MIKVVFCMSRNTPEHHLKKQAVLFSVLFIQGKEGSSTLVSICAAGILVTRRNQHHSLISGPVLTHILFLVI
jgi:hypothetical protein